MAQRDGTSSRIAIKFGGSTTGSSSRQPRRPPPSTLGKRHRAGHALDRDGSSDEANSEAENGRHETITEFGASGASNRRRSRSPRDSQSSRNNRGRKDKETRRSSDLDKSTPEDRKEPTEQFGLIVNKKPRKEEDPRDSANGQRSSSTEKQSAPRSADEEALSALLGEKRKPLLANSNPGDDEGRSPEPEDYAKVPIEDFGAHLLKGFGWDGADELDAWQQKLKNNAKGGSSGSDKPRRPRLDEYRREEEKRKARREERKRDSERSSRDGRDRSRDRHGGGYDRDRGRDRR
ncbi:hypothetical protein DL546_004052 [Coniochaeta pulveracea]|uniref:Spp2/MOS2 G-patch domain-containing protein n=1 Tax=Coniochaeta pulveracea TaxID=177199 RepID=A0A420Y6P9_9PEZI|nr:hypothetical protein DL546_004052 [Coniochaeta pulveracea]